MLEQFLTRLLPRSDVLMIVIQDALDACCKRIGVFLCRSSHLCNDGLAFLCRCCIGYGRGKQETASQDGRPHQPQQNILAQILFFKSFTPHSLIADAVAVFKGNPITADICDASVLISIAFLYDASITHDCHVLAVIAGQDALHAGRATLRCRSGR